MGIYTETFILVHDNIVHELNTCEPQAHEQYECILLLTAMKVLGQGS